MVQAKCNSKPKMLQSFTQKEKVMKAEELLEEEEWEPLMQRKYC